MELSARRRALLRRLRRRKTREREALYLMEGVRGVEEALAAGASVSFAVVAPGLDGAPGGAELRDRLQDAEIDVVVVDDALLSEVADTETPQGVLLVCREPAWTLDDLTEEDGILLLDGLQDPGNAGTLIRAAAAFGVGGVVALDGTVDPWNAKTVRAMAGGGFRTRIVRARWSDAGPWLQDRGVVLLAADARGQDVAGLDHAVAGRRWALAVGNEGAGCRPAVLQAASRRVAVPMPGGAESLNAGVAGSILLYVITSSRPGPGSAPTPLPGDAVTA